MGVSYFPTHVLLLVRVNRVLLLSLYGYTCLSEFQVGSLPCELISLVGIRKVMIFSVCPTVSCYNNGKDNFPELCMLLKPEVSSCFSNRPVLSEEDKKQYASCLKSGLSALISIKHPEQQL